jgi:Rap1a immunity proteins
VIRYIEAASGQLVKDAASLRGSRPESCSGIEIPGQPCRNSRRRNPPMKYARTLSIGLVATVAFAWSEAAAVENARELASYCQSLERGATGPGRHIYIPRTREALTCWGYMQAMQDLSVLADEEGHRIMGACPPEQTTTLQLIQSFVRYAGAHRTELQGNAVVAVFRALREAYPCRAEHG